MKRLPGLTIVGGQPSKRRKKGNIRIPVGIEKLLFLAASHPEFKTLLLTDRDAACSTGRVNLRPSESQTLAHISNKTLENMIDNVVPLNPKRRKFMGLVATAAAAAISGSSLTGCFESEGPDMVDAGANGDASASDDDSDTITTDEPDPTEIDTGTSGNTENDFDTETVTADEPDPTDS